MPEKVNNKKIFSLLEVMKSIEKTITGRYTSSFWVKAEMNKVNLYQRSGHCYPELVQKESGKVIAQSKSMLWKEDYISINNKFIEVLKEPLKDGIKILFLAKITFTPFHGLALQILDIDPSYTLGDLEREKQETIQHLRNKGIFDKNKTLKLALLPQRIAVISVETSKGYADFLNVISNNPWNYKFFHMLFPSLLQGEKAVDGLIHQLRRIRKVKDNFDIVAIIRGGGGDIGLSCYNNRKLAEEIALFPLPVITGIGHATNETVVEMISFTNAITPTKLADYLLQVYHNFSVPVQRAEEIIADKATRLINEETNRLQASVKIFRSLAENILQKGRGNIRNLSDGLQLQARLLLKEKDLELSNVKKNIDNMSPQNVMKRGYSITTLNGKALKSTDKVKTGDILQTSLYDGRVISKVESTDKPKEE